MKVAFVLDQFPTISETFILNQITGLVDRGHEVDIYACRQGDTRSVHGDVQRYGLLARTAYVPYCPRRTIKRVSKGVALLLLNLHKGPGALLRSLNVLKYGRQAASLRVLYSVIPWLGKTYDIIHCHFGPFGLRGLRIREVLGVSSKIVVSLHGYDMSAYLDTHGANVYTPLFNQADCLLPISDYWSSKLKVLGCPDRKVRVHRMGVDCRSLPFKARSPCTGKPIRCISVARFVEKKGLQYAIQAVAQLVQRCRQIEYTIVGDGPLRSQCEDLIRHLNAESTIHIVGWKRQDEVRQLLADSHVFLYPSVTAAGGDQEGIPVAIMEAMAGGLPVISTYHSGIPELVRDGHSGVLVPERDADALADGLGYLIDHPEVWPEMGRAGRAHVEANYDINTLNDRLVEIYERLLNA